jgi:hypothetical protein
MKKRFCTLDDSIKCLQCGAIAKVHDLIKIFARPIPNSEKLGEFWYPAFYHCPCDHDHPIVYTQGDGDFELVYLAKAELLSLIKQ